MDKTEEIIIKYASSPEPIEGFGQWLLSDKETDAKLAALAKVWAELENSPALDNFSARRIKCAKIISLLPEATSRKPILWISFAAAVLVAVCLFPLKKALQESPSKQIDPIKTAVTTPPSVCEDNGNPGKPLNYTLACVPIDNSNNNLVISVVPDSTHTNTVNKTTETKENVGSTPVIKPIPEIIEFQNSKTKNNVSISLFVSGSPLPSNQTSYASVPSSLGLGGFISASSANTSLIHRIPISIGLNLSFPFNKDWSIESGVAYSFLHSMRYETAQKTPELNQYLHYLSIPLYMRRLLLDRKNYSLYLSCGGSISYCVSGQVIWANGNIVSIKEHPFQVAATASLGADYSIVRNALLFGEISMNRYFDDGVTLESYYSANPYAPSVKFGIRMTI